MPINTNCYAHYLMLAVLVRNSKSCCKKTILEVQEWGLWGIDMPSHPLTIKKHCCKDKSQTTPRNPLK
jgi:hypothetical protein